MFARVKSFFFRTFAEMCKVETTMPFYPINR